MSALASYQCHLMVYSIENYQYQMFRKNIGNIGYIGTNIVEFIPYLIFQILYDIRDAYDIDRI